MGKLKRSHPIPPLADENEKIRDGIPEAFQNGNRILFSGKELKYNGALIQLVAMASTFN
jgi:hypothetical protein